MAKSWYHRELMESYYLAREVQEREAEEYSIGYATELREFYSLNRRVTFKDWLSEFPRHLGYDQQHAA